LVEIPVISVIEAIGEEIGETRGIVVKSSCSFIVRIESRDCCF